MILKFDSNTLLAIFVNVKNKDLELHFSADIQHLEKIHNELEWCLHRCYTRYGGKAYNHFFWGSSGIYFGEEK